MRTAVISDIHSNLEAFEAVLADIDNCGADAAVCLGDIVGYGPQPEEVIDLIRERKIPCVMGNHDLAVMDDEELSHFVSAAADAIIVTRRVLSESAVEYLNNLPATFTTETALHVHGAPPDSVRAYIFELADTELVDVVASLPQSVTFVGHTHLLLLYEISDGDLTVDHLYPGITNLEPSRKYVINIGSVGQPRDGSPDAKYVVFDDEQFTVELRCVSYDVSKTVELILQSPFPDYNANRLPEGR